MDKQGRILVPATLRKYAKIDKELIFVGMLNKFEIWSKELWDKELEKARENFEDISESLAEFGI
jgi:MraZ protein